MPIAERYYRNVIFKRVLKIIKLSMSSSTFNE